MSDLKLLKGLATSAVLLVFSPQTMAEGGPSAESTKPLEFSSHRRLLGPTPNVGPLSKAPSSRPLIQTPNARSLGQAASALPLSETPSTLPPSEIPSVRPLSETPSARPLRQAPSDGQNTRIQPPPDFSFGSGLANTSSTASSGPLELASAVEHAVRTHPSIRQAMGFLGQSIENIDVAKAGYYPRIEGGVRSEYDNSASNPYDSSSVQKAVVSASQMLYDFGKVSSAVDQAQAQRVASNARVLLSIDQVSRETTYAFIETQRYQTLTELAAAQVDRVSAIADLARERRAMGASTLSDETQAQSREASAQSTFLDMRSQAERWQQNVVYLSGLNGIESVSPLIPKVFELACATEAPDWGLLPEVLVAEAERAEALASLENADAQSLPTLSIEGTLGRALNTTTQSGRRNDATAMLNFAMPFYQGGAMGAQKRAARSVLGAADAAANNARLSASQNLIEARNRAQGYQQRIGVLSERIESILLTRDLYREQYLGLGTRTLLDLLNAEQEYHQARFENANNIHDMRRMQVDCLYSSGHMREAFDLSKVDVVSSQVTP